MTQLRIARRAEEHIHRISAWWQENRPAAPRLFSLEVADALELLAEAADVVEVRAVWHATRRRGPSF